MKEVLLARIVRVVAFAWIALTGCASTPGPATLSAESQRIAAIDKITLLPTVVLAEIKPRDRKMLTEVIETQLPLELALKGYVLSKAEAYSPTANYSPADIAAMNEMEMAKLGAKNDRYILVCFVNAISSQYLVVAKTGHASLAAVLLDKQTSEVLWSNKSDKSDTLDWMFDMGLIFIPFINQKANVTYQAFRELFKSFPEAR